MDIESASRADKTIVILGELIRRKFELSNDEDTSVYEVYKTYIKYQKELRVNSDGIVFYKNRFLVPQALRAHALEIMHIGHQGVYSMNLFAESNFFWPGISSDILKLRQYCWSCNENAPSLSNLPPHPVSEPTYPFQMMY